MKHTFLKKDNIPDYLGTGVILDVIFKRAKNQIKDVYGDAKKWIDEIKNRSIIEKFRHPIDWLDSMFNKDFVLDFYNGITEIEDDLMKIAKKDSCFTKGFNKII
jgi:CYTH domain-containing protein